jgi:hypothetical protein
MLFVAICEHAPRDRPASNREIQELVMDTQTKIPDKEKRHGIKNLGTHVLHASHRQVLILEAPDYSAVEAALTESNVLMWNTVDICESLMGEEVFNLAFQTPTG